jgi:hypothetical protein
LSQLDSKTVVNDVDFTRANGRSKTEETNLNFLEQLTLSSQGVAAFKTPRSYFVNTPKFEVDQPNL